MKKVKKIAIIFSIILLIGVSAFAAVYYFTDIFKTPQEAFYSYIEKATTFDNNSSYQEMLEALKVAQTKSYKSETSIGIEFNSKEKMSSEEQAMLGMLKNLKVNVNTNAKPSEKKSTSEISLNFGGFSAGNLKLVRDGEIFGLKSELLDNKYIAVENKNLKELFAKFGANTSNVPDKLESIDMYDLLYISPEDEFNLEKTYKDIFKNNIPAERFSKEENVTQKINGEEKKTTAYKLSLSEEDFINVMEKVLETVQEDDKLLNIITEKFNKLVESGMFDEINVSSSYSLPSTLKTKKSKITSTISADVLKQELKEIINEFKEEKQYASTSKVEIIVYAVNNDIAKLEVKANNEVQVAAEFFKQNDKKHVVLYAMQNSYSSYKSYNYNKDYYAMPKNLSKLTKIMEIEYKSTKGFNDRTLDASLIIFEDDEQVAKVSFDITSKGKVGQGTNESNGKITFEFDGNSISLLVDSKVEYTDNVSVESINNQNANILNNMSKKEIEQYFQGIVGDLENTLSMFGMKNSIKIPNKSWSGEEYIDGSNDLDEIDDKTDSIDKEELEKQIQELNKQLKELQESNS